MMLSRFAVALIYAFFCPFLAAANDHESALEGASLTFRSLVLGSKLRPEVAVTRELRLSGKLNDPVYSSARILHSRVELPKFFAKLQRIFPDATYGFLGRDTNFLADAAWLYFDRLGQAERVKRVNLSTELVERMVSERYYADTLVPYLEYLGLGQRFGQDGKIRPFVFIDPTRFLVTSQSATIMGMLSNHVNSVPDPRWTMGDVYFLSTLPTETTHRLANIDRFLKVPETYFVWTEGQRRAGRELSEIATIPLPIDPEQGTGLITHGSEWSGPFDDLRYEPVSDLLVPKASRSEISAWERSKALKEQIQLIDDFQRDLIFIETSNFFKAQKWHVPRDLESFNRSITACPQKVFNTLEK